MLNSSFLYFSSERPENSLRGFNNENTSAAWTPRNGSTISEPAINACIYKNETEKKEINVFKIDELFLLYQSARIFCEGIPSDQLKSALLETSRIMNSGIFPDFIKPNVGVDECGEFSISIANNRGYLDIGVSGDGDISYHVRNDEDPSKTAYGDTAWDGLSLPDNLLDSAVHFLNG